MIDKTALSYVNLYGIFGAIPKLCELDEEAHALIADDHISIGFSVRGGPCATLIFDGGTVSLEEGLVHPTIKIPFSSPEKFNGMIDGTVTPIPSKGFTRIGFLLKKFVKLTDVLSRYLRPSEEDLADEEFFCISTVLMFHVITGAVSQIGNEDRIGRASASYIVDGNVRMLISEDGKTVAAAHIVAKDHHLRTVPADTENAMSMMEFVGIRNARGLFDGTASSFTLICNSKLHLKGMISQLDNVNRILDRVALYLA